MVVCHCEAVSDRVIRPLLDEPGLTVEDLVSRCGVGSQCGGCLPTLRQLLEGRRAAAVIAG